MRVLLLLVLVACTDEPPPDDLADAGPVPDARVPLPDAFCGTPPPFDGTYSLSWSLETYDAPFRYLTRLEVGADTLTWDNPSTVEPMAVTARVDEGGCIVTELEQWNTGPFELCPALCGIEGEVEYGGTPGNVLRRYTVTGRLRE